MAAVIPTTNTGAVNLGIDVLGIKDLKDSTGSELDAGDFVSGTAYLLVYTGSEWRIGGGG